MNASCVAAFRFHSGPLSGRDRLVLLLLVSLALVAFWEVVEGQGLGDIYRAVYQDRTDEVRTLPERDPGLANTLSKGDMDPLHVAAAKGGIEIVRLLVAAGADVITRTLNGTTPLSFGVVSDHGEIADFLRDAGGVA